MPDRKAADPAPPRLTAASALDSAPTDDLSDRDEFADIWLSGARVMGIELDRPECTDIRIEDCDISGLVATDGVIRRLEVRRSRLRGIVWSGAQCDDILVEDCDADELALRFCRLRRVVFRNCRLPKIDAYTATFDDVRFENCDLSRANFGDASVRSLRITHCDLAGVRGASGLAGAVLDVDDLPALAPSLAREAGITIADSS